MDIASINELKEALILIGHERPEPIEGATRGEIEAAKVQQGVDYLPELYYQFLLTMGREAGHLYLGSHYSVRVLPQLKERAKQLLTKDGLSYELPDDAFVFRMHGGYEFLFFQTGLKNDNPPVYIYYEKKGEPKMLWKSLLDHYSSEINHLTNILEYERRQREERMKDWDQNIHKTDKNSSKD